MRTQTLRKLQVARGCATLSAPKDVHASSTDSEMHETEQDFPINAAATCTASLRNAATARAFGARCMLQRIMDAAWRLHHYADHGEDPWGMPRTFSMYTNRVAIAMAGMTRPVRGTSTEGAHEGGTNG